MRYSIIEDIRELLAIVKSCRDSLNVCYDARKIASEDRTSILSNFRRLSNGTEQIDAAIKISRCKELSREVDTIKARYLDYKIAATGGSFPSGPYNQKSISAQEQASRALSAALQSLIFKTNKYHKKLYI